MSGRRARRVGVVLLLGATTTGVAVAATRGPADQVSGAIDVTVDVTVPPGFHPCGEDQDLGVLEATLVGTATSSDPRLAGDVTMRVRRVTDEDGPGADASSVSIRDPDTGRLTARGTFVAVNTGTNPSGVLDLQLHRPAGHAVVVIGFRREPADTPTGFKLHGEYGRGHTAPATGVVTKPC